MFSFQKKFFKKFINVILPRNTPHSFIEIEIPLPKNVEGTFLCPQINFSIKFTGGFDEFCFLCWTSFSSFVLFMNLNLLRYFHPKIQRTPNSLLIPVTSILSYRVTPRKTPTSIENCNRMFKHKVIVDVYS